MVKINAGQYVVRGETEPDTVQSMRGGGLHGGIEVRPGYRVVALGIADCAVDLAQIGALVRLPSRSSSRQLTHCGRARSSEGMLFVNISFWIILLYFANLSLPGWATKTWLPTLFSENLSIDSDQLRLDDESRIHPVTTTKNYRLVPCVRSLPILRQRSRQPVFKA